MMSDIEIDLETSYEFIKEIFNQIKPDQFQALIKQLEQKQTLFQTLLKKESLLEISNDNLTVLLQKMFSTKRLMKKWSEDQYEKFKSYSYELLYGTDDFDKRFERFCTLSSNNLKMKKAFEIASELLAFSDPSKYWSWYAFMWNPETDTGSLALVFNDRKFLQENSSLTELYKIVGFAQDRLKEKSKDLGIEVTGETNIYDVPVFLGAVYSVYLYTVTRVRMTNEFTTILPSKLELLKRLLGIYSSEITK